MVSLTQQSEWVRALREQDHAAFEKLVGTYTPLVASCARRYGLSASELEDVVSSTFLKAYRGLPAYRGEAALETWLYRIAYHQSINVLRRIGRERQSRQEDVPEQQISNPLQLLEHEELTEELHGALKQLPNHWMEVILLRYWNHMSIAQIAKVMQVSNPVIRSYLFRARQRLRMILETGN